MARGPEDVFDEYLVLLAADGSREAVADLVARWSPRLLRHAMRLLHDLDAAKDVTQDTWVGALRGLRSLGDPARFPAWIYAIASRKCADRIRSNMRRRRLRAAIVAQPRPVSCDPELGRGLDLSAALGRLPFDQRLVVSLFYGEDLTVSDIARVVGAAEGTIKSRLHHARAALKGHLEEGQNDRD
jgi:RNA polymerase sigma-70 factor (ECF subfamily)